MAPTLDLCNSLKYGIQIEHFYRITIKKIDMTMCSAKDHELSRRDGDAIAKITITSLPIKILSQKRIWLYEPTLYDLY